MPRLLLPLLLLALPAAAADVTLIGVGTLPGDASDLSGLKGKGSNGTPHDRLGGHGSAIAYTGKGDEYVLMSDRGPADGASDFACRFHRMSIAVLPDKSPAVSLKLSATTLLTTDDGKQLVGSLGAFTLADAAKNLRFDPEGMRVGPKGELFASDEYGPLVAEFDAKGKRVKVLPVPAKFQTVKPSKSPADESPPKATTGRLANRGLEGLAITPDGGKLVAAMQSPLIQDGGGFNAKPERMGRHCRLLEIDRATGKTREFVYTLDEPTNGVNEILAINDHEFLVLERDSKLGKDAALKKVFRIDITAATDVSGTDALPVGDLPKDIKAATKTLFLDLLDPAFGIAGKDCPEKFEGLAFGPDLPDGRRRLLVTADNDFIATAPFRVYAFAVKADALKGYEPQKFDSR
jgi:hypothetical protein